MNDSFDTPLSEAESKKLVSDIITPLTIRKRVEELQARASDMSYDISNRDAGPKVGLDTLSGLFVYVCLSFIPKHLIRKKECRPDYPDGWYIAAGKRITISYGQDFAQFFLDGTPRKRDNGDDLTDVGVKIYTAIVQKLHPEPSGRWLAALGLLLAYDEGLGRGGKCFCAGREIEREEIERKATVLTVQYDGHTCSRDFVASVLEIYATKVCKAIVAKPQQPCPHCGQLKPKKKVCPHCGIVGDMWTCPSCGTRTPIADIPNHGSSNIYCPGVGCGLPIVGATQLLSRFRAALKLPPDKGMKELKAIQLECGSCGASWIKLSESIRQVEVAQTALGNIATAVQRKDISAADALLASAKRDFPNLDYSHFERQIATLKAEKIHLENQKKELCEAEATIQNAINTGNYSVARSKVAEKAKKNLPGFKADEWLIKIKRAEITALQSDYESAWKAAEWDKAKRIGKSLADLGEKTVTYWNKDVDRHRQSYKRDLEAVINAGLSVVSSALNQMHIAEAEEALKKAKDTQEIFKKAFPGGASSSKISDAEKALANKKSELLVGNLCKVKALTATGSTDGPCVITVSWKPASGGTQAAKWRVVRREKGKSDQKTLCDTERTLFVDKGSGVRIGVEYEYGVIPLAQVVISGKSDMRPNENAIVWSEAVLCLVKLPVDALSGKGEGIEGGVGIVELTWSISDRFDANRFCSLTLSREDGGFTDVDVNEKNGFFSDTHVMVERSYKYVLTLRICGKDCGTSSTSVIVKKLAPPLPVQNLRYSGLKKPDGRSVVEWDWPSGIDTCIWAFVAQRIGNMEEVVPSDRNKISRATYTEMGGLPIPTKRAYGWIAVSGVRVHGVQELVSSPNLLPSGESIITYHIENHPGSLFSKRRPSAVIMTSSTGYIPEIEVHAGRSRSEVLSKSGGRVAMQISQRTSSSIVREELDGYVSPGEFIRLYLAKSENCSFEHPKECEVK